jgi:hypothetical protein
VVCEAFACAPDARADPGGSDRAVAQLDGVDRLARERVLDLHGERLVVCPGARDPHVAAAIDGDAGVSREAPGERVGGQALAGAAAVDPNAGRARDRPCVVVDRDLARAGIALWRGAPSRRRRLEGGPERGGSHTGERVGVARALDLVDQRGVGQAAARVSRPHCRGHGRAQQR